MAWGFIFISLHKHAEIFLFCDEIDETTESCRTVLLIRTWHDKCIDFGPTTGTHICARLLQFGQTKTSFLLVLQS